MKRRAVLIHIINRWLSVEKGVIPLDQSSSLSAWRRGGSPRRSAHPQTRCIFTSPDFLPPLPRRSLTGFFNPAIPTGVFPHCSLHIWPHMSSHRQSKLRRQFAHSQFSAMATIIWKSHKIEFNQCCMNLPNLFVYLDLELPNGGTLSPTKRIRMKLKRSNHRLINCICFTENSNILASLCSAWNV